MSRVWFRRHKSGTVWYPSSWEGWTVLIVYYVTLIYSFFQSDNNWMSFLPKFFVLSALLISVTYLKSEQKPLK